MNLNIVLGIILLIGAAGLWVMAFLLAVKQYLRTPKVAATLPSEDLIKMFLQLLDDILKAPPALAFLVAGLLTGSVGIWLLVVKPI